VMSVAAGPERTCIGINFTNVLKAFLKGLMRFV
jgi:hypothetical protein